MPEGSVELVHGTARCYLTPSTQEDFAYVHANLRELDRFEHEHFRKHIAEDVDTLAMFEKCWTIYLFGDIVGYVGLQIAGGRTVLANERFIPMLTTVHADKHKVDFARLTKTVLAFVSSQAGEWVTDFYSIPLAKYEASVRWHEKTMGWHRVAELDAFGEKAVVFHIGRKEIVKWRR